MRRSRACIATAVVVFLCAGIPAHAALTKDEQQCQNTAAKKGRVFFKKRLNALSKCHDSILARSCRTTTDCELEPKTMAKIDKAEQKLRDKIAASCPDTRRDRRARLRRRLSRRDDQHRPAPTARWREHEAESTR